MRSTQRKNKLVYLALNAALFLMMSVTCSLAGVSISMLKAGSNIGNDSDFTYEYNGHNFKCYKIEGSSNEVEIGWADSTDLQIASLTVPGTVSDGTSSYSVTAVVQGGFRYCQFQEIVLPASINSIEEEAFAYCTRMESFVLPYNVTEIKNSTFLDCRALVHFFYTDADGNQVVTNSKVTSIGDHAFDSCVSLTDFTLSTVISSLGVSCFQNCETITRFYFPSKTGTGANINNISVSSYAFADCSSLVWVYFESNLVNVDNYAFVDCNSDLVFHYGYEGTYPGDPTFTSMWRRVSLSSGNTDVYPIEGDHIVIYQSNEYPGLKYTIENIDRYLDCHRDNTPASQKIMVIDHTDGKYAVIYSWSAPVITVPNYYNVSTKALEIPGEIEFDGVTYPVKVINRETFANKAEDIRSVKFNNGLVQICRRAFYKDNLITNLDFSECDTLVEISNDIFNHVSSGTVNNVMTSLTLPNSLEYLGKYAFYGFRYIEHLSFKTHADQSGNLKVLGGYCFARLAEKYQTAKIDVTLPCTLNDAYAVRANINYSENNDYNDTNFAAIGAYCFGNESGDYTEPGFSKKSKCTCVKRVSMEACTHAHADDNSYRCSVAPNAFNRATYLTKFVSNENLCMIGNEAFKNCTNLREIFICTKKAAASGLPVPYGTSDGGQTFKQTIISGDAKAKSPELVIYLDGPAPGNINSLTGITSNDFVAWNGERGPMYETDFGYRENPDSTSVGGNDWITVQSRSSIPTLYNSDFDFSSGSILYYKPSNGTFLTEEPSLLADYNQGIIALVKAKNEDTYTVARYYSDNSHVTNEIDLSQITHPTLGNISSKITSIGPEAFGRDDKSLKAGFYFILPESLTKIDERAFFHKADNTSATGLQTSGVRIVTYRTGGVVQPSQSVYNSAKSAIGSSYCNLPANLTYIGRNAFYNNNFSSVTLGSQVSFIGKSAFFSMVNTSAKTGRSQLSSISIGTNSNFEVVSNGLYYKGTNRMLLYQAQNITGSLTIASGTKGVAASGCAGTMYSSIELPTGLTHVYGGAFQYNTQLTTIVGGSSLKYIGAPAPNDELYDSSMPFDNVDFKNRYDEGAAGYKYTKLSAFQDNPLLSTVNFKAMTNLVKIGHAAFRRCPNLEQCAGGASYSYYSYNGTTPVLTETVTTGVLDLSPCTSLRVIGRNAFSSSKINYVHLPMTNGLLSVARDKTDFEWYNSAANGKIFESGTPKFLIGDIADLTCRSVTYTHANSNRWSNVWYGSSEIYFHVTQRSDILTSGQVSQLKYWTENPSGGYILFESQANAEAYFPA